MNRLQCEAMVPKQIGMYKDRPSLMGDRDPSYILWLLGFAERSKRNNTLVKLGELFEPLECVTVVKKTNW